MSFRKATAATLMLACVCVVVYAEDAVPATPEAAAKPAAEGDEWQFELMPYVFLFKTDGDLAAKGMSVKAEASMGNLLDALEGGFLLRFEGMKGRWGFYTNIEYMKLGSSVRNPSLGASPSGGLPNSVKNAIKGKLLGKLPPGVDPERAKRILKAIWNRLSPEQQAAVISRIKSKIPSVRFPSIDRIQIEFVQVALDAGVIYRAVDMTLGEKEIQRLQLDLTAGARYVYLKEKTKISITSGSLGKLPDAIKSRENIDWVDPVVGTHIKYFLNHRLAFGLRGDMGGFGIGSGSHMTVNAVGYIQYNVTESFGLDLGYRVTDMDYRKGSGDDRFRYDMNFSGPFAGAVIRF